MIKKVPRLTRAEGHLFSLRVLLFLHRCLDAAQGLGAQAEERSDVLLRDDADNRRVLLEEPFVAFLAALRLGGDLPLDV